MSPFFGGVQMYWTAEAQTRTETEPEFKQMELKAWELSGYSVSSNVLLQDSVIGLEKFLMTLFGKAIAWFEEYAFLQGNGVGKPQGMLGQRPSPPATTPARRPASRPTRCSSPTWRGCGRKLLPHSWGQAIWTCSPTVVPQLLQLKDGANRAIFYRQSTRGRSRRRRTGQLLGRPAFPTEKVPALGTKGDLMLLDPSLYVIGDRMQIEIAASEHVNFLKNQMTWRSSSASTASRGWTSRSRCRTPRRRSARLSSSTDDLEGQGTGEEAGIRKTRRSGPHFPPIGDRRCTPRK